MDLSYNKLSGKCSVASNTLCHMLKADVTKSLHCAGMTAGQLNPHMLDGLSKHSCCIQSVTISGLCRHCAAQPIHPSHIGEHSYCELSAMTASIFVHEILALQQQLV